MSQPLHLINPMLHVSGAELRTVHLYRLLAPHGRVTVWGHRRAPAELRQMVPIETLDPLRLRFPRSGVLAVMGAYFPWFLAKWLVFCRPVRTVLLYNLHDPQDLEATLHLVSRNGRRPVELVYASEVLQREAGWPGVVEDSPIDLATFSPSPVPRHGDAFVVGRCSRDRPFKYAAGDPALFRRLAQRGCTVRLVGATCLRSRLGDVPNVELLPEIEQRAMPDFLRGLDCFVYRTSPGFQEAYGRVVAEAMACGVPVIVEPRVGASKHVVHGVNGFLAGSDDDVEAAVEYLRSNPGHRTAIAAAARQTIERVGGWSHRKAIIDFYLGGARPDGQPRASTAAPGLATPEAIVSEGDGSAGRSLPGSG